MSPQQKADPPLNHAACYASKKQTALLSTAACAISVTVRTHNDLLHTACMHAPCVHPTWTAEPVDRLLPCCRRGDGHHWQGLCSHRECCRPVGEASDVQACSWPSCRCLQGRQDGVAHIHHCIQMAAPRVQSHANGGFMILGNPSLSCSWLGASHPVSNNVCLLFRCALAPHIIRRLASTRERATSSTTSAGTPGRTLCAAPLHPGRPCASAWMMVAYHTRG